MMPAGDGSGSGDGYQNCACHYNFKAGFPRSTVAWSLVHAGGRRWEERGEGGGEGGGDGGGTAAGRPARENRRSAVVDAEVEEQEGGGGGGWRWRRQ